jgi:hypothetical protein
MRLAPSPPVALCTDHDMLTLFPGCAQAKLEKKPDSMSYFFMESDTPEEG